VIRALTLIGVACFAGAIVLFATGDGSAPIGIVLVLIAIGISIVLGIRRGYHAVRNVVGDARRFVSGDLQTARIVDVGDPKGIFNTRVDVQLELEGEDGTVHAFERDVPVPMPVAWSFRLGKRFNLPLVRTTNLAEMMAFEFKREGMDVSVGRPSRVVE
jgi:hypothetical protein